MRRRVSNPARGSGIEGSRSPGRDGGVRRRTRRWALLLALLTPAALVGVQAQQAPANQGALFLVFPIGAYPAGMGQVGSTLEGRGEAAFWNPAGLATVEQGEFALHTATLAAGRTHAVGAFFPSARIGVLGGAVYLVDYGNLEATDSTGAPIARVSPRNVEFLASYATTVGRGLFLGVNYKLVEFRVDCSGDCRDFPNGHGLSHALDVGGQFTIGDGPQALRIGIVLRNIGFRLQVQNEAQADPLPARFVVGAMYRMPIRTAADIPGGGQIDVQVAADVESPWREAGRAEARLGVDIGFEQLVRLRGGYAFVQDGLSGPSIGMGLRTGSLGVDLARLFITGSDLLVPNPTFFSFHLAF